MKKLNWKSIVGWGIAALVAGFIVYSNMQEQKALQNSGKKNVYAVLPLTGLSGHIGTEQKAAIELWKKKNPNAPFNIHIIDSETTPMKAITALRQALLDEENPVVITSNSGISYNSLPIIEEKNGFEFMVCTFEREGLKNKHFLRPSDRNRDSMQPVAKYLSKYKKLVLFYTNEDFGKSSVNGLKKLLKQYEIEPLEIIAIEPNQLNIHIEALKALKEKPEAIGIFGLMTLGTVNLIKELRMQGFTKDIVTGAGLADPSNLSKLENYFDKLIFPDKKMQLTEGPNVPILREIEQIIGGRPYFVPLEVWDTLDLINWTIKNNKPFTQETYAKLGKWKGIAGDIEFLDDGNVIYEFYLATFKDGKIVPVESKKQRDTE